MMKRILIITGLCLVLGTLFFPTPALAKRKIGHFGVDGFHAWRPPLDDLHPGTPLEELKEYFAWESAMLADAGITWNRTLSPAAWPFSWHCIERTKGDYDFTWADLLVKAAQNQNLSLLAMVAPFTPWDSPDCNDRSYRKPNDMNAYKTFMSKLVERYDGDGVRDMPGLKYGIKYWEIGNEPEGAFIEGVSGYLETHKAAYEAVKEADSEAKVLNGGACPVYNPATSELAQQILDFWDSFFAAGGGDYIDVFNIHYTSPEPAPPLKDFLDQWGTLLNKYGLEKDIWVTETSTYSETLERWGTTYPTQTEEDQAGWWVKHTCYGLAHGVRKFFWAIFYYGESPQPPGEGQPPQPPGEGQPPQPPGGGQPPQPPGGGQPPQPPGGGQPPQPPGGGQLPEAEVSPPPGVTEWQPLAAMIDSDKSPRLIYTTQRILSSKIDGFTSVLELAETQYKFIVGDKPIYVLWGTGSIPSEITGMVTVIDIYGNEATVDATAISLTDRPIFVETLI